jgi:hypothetical protein
MAVKTYEKFSIHHYLRTIWVFLTFMVIDYLYYGVIAPSGPYSQDFVGKLIWSAILALAFTALYSHASTWRPKVDSNTPGNLGDRMLNGILFSLLIFALILSAIAMSHYIVSVVFIYVLDGFRGIPEGVADDCVLCGKIVIGGVVLEVCGKDETSERRDG